MVASKHLETMGHDVTSVGDGESAIAALGETAYDMVLLDMNLPDMDGEKLVRKVRSGEAGGKSADAAFIAVTGRAMAGDRERLLESGLDGYVAKPLGPEELRAELRRVAANRS
jgi:CheY-like chemotaxis protein